MNRLIILGNGFDRAHNLKTRYEDFLWDFFSSCLNKAGKNSGFLDDKLLYIQRYVTLPNLDDKTEVTKSDFDEAVKGLGSNGNHPREILSEIFARYPNGWVDLEKVYYEGLLDRLPKSVIDYNNSFQYLGEKLVEYIREKVHPKITDDIKINGKTFFITKSI